MPLNLYWKQRIIQLYLESVRSYGEVVRMLRDEGKIVPKKTVWSVVRKYKEHGMLSRLPGSGRQPKVTEEVLALVESKMQSDDETTAVNLVANRQTITGNRQTLNAH